MSVYRAKRQCTENKEEGAQTLAEWWDEFDRCITLDPSGMIYSAAFYPKCLETYNTDGLLVRKWCTQALDIKSAMALSLLTWDERDPYVMEELKMINEIRMFPPGIAPLCADYRGTDCLCVVEGEQHRASVFRLNSLIRTTTRCLGYSTCFAHTASDMCIAPTRDTSLICTLGQGEGTDGGQFRFPNSCAIGSNGLIYITDSHNDRVQAFDSKGRYVRMWGGTGSGASEFHYPTGIIVMTEHLYVADCGNQRIQCFTLDGTYRGQWQVGTITYPRYIAGAHDDTIYISDVDQNIIRQFCRHGTLKRSYNVSSPTNMAVSTDRIYVACGDSPELLLAIHLVSSSWHIASTLCSFCP